MPANVQDIFLAAADLLDPNARATYLDRACGGDAVVRSRVEALLKAHGQPDSLLDVPIHPLVGGETRTAEPTPEGNPDSVSTRTHGHSAGHNPDDDLAVLSPSDRPGSLGRLGQYHVLEVLGRGGFGTVYRAFDDKLQRVVAVKVLAPQMAATSPARKRFLREARATAAIKHDHVVQIYDTQELPLPYLVMEYVPGETLQQRLDRKGPIELVEVLRIGRQVAEGLAAAHATGLVHRDVKPANVLIEEGPHGRVKLTDFGLARAADDASISQSGIVAGTPMYMAPEQAKGDTLDHRADLFSLGSVLYAISTGRPPFRAGSMVAVLKRVVEENPRPMRDVIPELPAWFCRIVEKLHAKDPAERFQSSRDVADLLADCERQLAEYGMLKNFSRIPGGGKPPANRKARKLATTLCGVAALFWMAFLFAEPAWRYATNQAAIELQPASGLKGISVMRDGHVVTDGYDSRTGPTIHLPPGKYKLEPTFSPGKTVERWEVTTRSTFASRSEWQGERTPEFEIARGEKVTVRAVMREESTTAGSVTGQIPAGWGTLVDPLGDCRATFEDNRLTLTVPGDGRHNLNPLPQWDNLNAPRIVRDVEGDFDVRVVVNPFPLPARGTAAGAGGSYVGAGLVIWQDDRKLLRFFRAGLGEYETKAPYVHAEWFPGTMQRPQEMVHVLDIPTMLNIRRTGQTLTLWYRTGNQPWTLLKSVTDLPLASRIGVGVAAVNSVKAEFNPAFESLILTPTTTPKPTSDDGFTPLFNGKNLTGWKPYSGNEATWVIENGVLTAKGGAGLLATDRADYLNFHLRAEVKINNQGDTGIVFRHRPGSSLSQVGTRHYEADIVGGSLGHLYTRMGGRELNKVSTKEITRAQSWVVFEVIARGGHIGVIMDGRVVLDVTEPDPILTPGHIILESATPKTAVQFRSIEIKELSASSPAMPKTAAEVLPFIMGNWASEAITHEPKLPPDKARSLRRLKFDAVAGGKVARGRATDEAGVSTSVTLHSFDPETDRFNSWYFSSEGESTASKAGVFDPDNRSLAWMEKLPDGKPSFQHMRFVNADTNLARYWEVGADNEIVYDVRTTFTRTDRPAPTLKHVVDPNRPTEMAVLDRFVGDWRTELTVRNSAVPGRPSVQTFRVKAESILGGRFLEMIDTDEAGNAGDYAVAWFDPEAKLYRQWLFTSRGDVTELRGTWDDAAKTMSWASQDGRTEGSWVFKDNDRRESRLVVKDPEGKVLSEVTGESRRIDPK